MKRHPRRDGRYPARDHYRGKAARGYDARRTATPGRRRKWAAEHSALDAMLDRVAPGSRVLDLPCGTGRFLPLVLDHSLSWTGGDISLDMLCEVRDGALADGGPAPSLFACEAEHLPFAEDRFDYVLSIRFFNLLPEATVRRVLAELARVSRRGVVIQVRLAGRTWLVDSFLRWLRDRFLPTVVSLLRRRALPARRRPEDGRTFPNLSRRRFAEIAQTAGLRIEHVSQVGGWRGYTHGDRLKLLLLTHLAG